MDNEQQFSLGAILSTTTGRMLTHIIECQHCGDTFQASRYDALYCSDKCRVKSHRERKQRAAQFERGVVALERLARAVHEKQGQRLSEKQLETVQHMQRVLAAMIDNYTASP